MEKSLFLVDWGSSNLRAWAVDENGQVKKSYTSDKGMLVLKPHEFEPELLRLLDDDLSEQTEVLICGMAGAAQGWQEAPYLQAPCKPPQVADAISIACKDARLNVKILPGIKQLSPPDVMRGEETQIAGFLSQEPSFDGLLVMPGTHTKWVRISSGVVQSFQTCMTGELFSLLSEQSILKHSVTGDGSDPVAFESGVKASFEGAAGLGADLFALRAATLVADQTGVEAKSRLSGLLIGNELKGTQNLWRNLPVALLGETKVAKQYENAFKLMSCCPKTYDTERLTFMGLKQALKS